MFEIQSCVHIPVVMDPATRACPFTQTKMFHVFMLMSATRAQLARSKGLADLVRLGEVDATHDYELDLDTGQWRRYQGRSSRSGASSSSQTDDFRDRVEKQAERFYRELSGEVEKLNRSLGWEQIIVIGERSQANFLEQALTTKPKQVIHKNLSQSSQQQILKQVF
ncbi:Host attachment protein [Exiguobacterium antarcticum B7]|nr:Host attachment protein [Exiguobacterium antarcticum B7]